MFLILMMIFFIWLIFRVYDDIVKIENIFDKKELIIDSIKGFKGDTEDSLTQVSATGESVMNIISTLSFILESSTLNQIKLDLSYTDHKNISLKIQKGTVNIYFDEYQGQFEKEQDDQQIAKLYLLIYLEIFPLLSSEYNFNVCDDVWNRDVKTDFMKRVAKNLTDRVHDRVLAIDAKNL